MQRHLARYRTGTLLQIELRDNSEALGSLGELSNASFQIVSIDSNRKLTFNYVDVAGVKKGREYIGAGSEPGHHVRHWVPIVAGTWSPAAESPLTKPCAETVPRRLYTHAHMTSGVACLSSGGRVPPAPQFHGVFKQSSETA